MFGIEQQGEYDMQFYINSTEVYVLVNPQLNATFDRTLDDCTVVLRANGIKNPFTPMQLFKIVNGTEKILFYIATDTVSLFSVDPLQYTHTIVLTQNIRKFSKHLLRNSVFSQPAQPYKKAFLSYPNVAKMSVSGGFASVYDKLTYETGTPTEWNEPLFLGTKERIKSAKIKFTGLYVMHNSSGSSIQTATDWNARFHRTPVVRIINSNNDILYSITLTTNLNKWIDITSVLESEGFGETIRFRVDGVSNDGIIATMFEATPENNYGRTNNPVYVVLQAELEAETYYWSAYDILNTIVEQQRLNTDTFTNPALFTLPLSGNLRNLLDKTIPPNMTFTQSTIFEAVSEVFELFDAVFTLNENNVLGIEYLNDLNGEEITPDFTGQKMEHGEDRFSNGLVAYYQNAKRYENYPSVNITNQKVFAHLRTTDLGVPSQNSHVFYLPHEIDYVVRLYSRVNATIHVPYFTTPAQTDTSVAYQGILINDYIIDISHRIFEKTLYSNLPSSNDIPYGLNWQNQTQQTSMVYTRGNKYIEVASDTYTTTWGLTRNSVVYTLYSGIFRSLGVSSFYATTLIDPVITNIAPNNYENYEEYLFNCEYISILNGRLKIESFTDKYNGEILVNQSQGALDLEKLGLNMVGISLQMGEPTLSATHKISSWANRIKKGQIYTDENGDKWLANICSYTIIGNDLFVGNITFVKNFNALSQNISIDKDKRLTNIDKNLTIKSEDNYCEYLYFSTTNFAEIDYELYNAQAVILNQGYNSYYDCYPATYLLASTFGVPLTDDEGNLILDAELIINEYKPTIAIFSAKVSGLDESSNLYLPLNKYGSGNAICFEMGYDDPVSAGNQTKYNATIYTKPLLYTDDDGWADTITIDFTTFTDNVFPQTFPLLVSGHPIVNTKLSNLVYYKKPNEIFALNYQLICLPTPKRANIDFIGNTFVKNNGLISSLYETDREMYVCVNTDGSKYSVLDQKAIGTYIRYRITGVSPLQYTTGKVIRLRVLWNGLGATAEGSWAICDELGNIYLASNDELDASEGEKNLYFLPSHYRLESEINTIVYPNLRIVPMVGYYEISGSLISESGGIITIADDETSYVTKKNGIIYANNY